MRRSPLGLLLVCFLLSGTTSLVYQVLWQRDLAIVLGSTTYATGVVLAVFMGGLALGGWAAARWADSMPRPLRAYGALEAAVGLYALATPYLFRAYVPLYQWLWQATGQSTPAQLVARIVLACVALLLPTACMGATLPLLTRICIDRPQTLGARLGLLYGANLLGAALGALGSALFLIPVAGIPGALRLTALVNLLLLPASLALERLVPEPGFIRTTERDEQPAAAVRLVALALGVSGALALVYEVAWTRALLLVIGSDTVAFATMLACTLLGLFIGSIVGGWLADRAREPLAVFGVVEALVGAGAWIGHLQFNRLPWLSISALEGDTSYALVRFGLAASVLLPSAVALGALFPLAARASGARPAGVGRIVGRLYAANTAGAIAGALAGSFALIPRAGLEITLQSAMIANGLLGCALFAQAVRQTREGRPLLRLAPVLAACLALAAWPVRWDMVTLVLAQTTRREAGQYARVYGKLPYVSEADLRAQLHDDQQLLFSEDGVSSHVAVIKNARNTSLLTNGHADGSDNEDMPTEVLLGAAPALFRPQEAAGDVAVIGWGTGVTAGVAEQFAPRRLVALELEPAVWRSSRYFTQVNHDALHAGCLHAISQDGRNYLLSAGSRRFDVIVSEPSNVWQAGVCNLFTRDFFELCRKRLAPGGLFTQWIGYGSMPVAEMRGILAALRSVFPHLLFLQVDGYDGVVLASERPVRLDMADAERRLQAATGAIRSDLQRAGISHAYQLAARIAFGELQTGELCGPEEPNTDDNARLESGIARADRDRSYAGDARLAIAAVRPPDPLSYCDTAGLGPAAAAASRAAAVKERELLSKQ